MNFKRLLIAAMAATCGVSLVACTTDQKISNESTRLVLATQELDGVFNPFYSTSATDSNIVGMTQISMLGSDKNGKVAYGNDEPVIVLDYAEKATKVNGKDATTYQFVLKNDVRFSNNSPLTMKDVLFNFYEYLDPLYYGSATLYSTDIVGLKEYRTQTINEAAQDSFNENFMNLADDRVLRLTDIAEIVWDSHKETLSYDDFKKYLKKEAEAFGEEYETVVEDFDRACEMFKKELEDDYTNNMDSYDSIKYTDRNGKEVSLSNDTEAFLYAEGYIQWNKDDYKFDYSYGEDSSKWNREKAIDMVYNTVIPKDIVSVISAYQTATNLREYFANLEKDKYFKETERSYKNISGIRFANRTEAVTVNNTRYETPTYASDGSVNSSNEVLEITIYGVDPKAIWNFGISIAPMYYYSSKELIDKFDYEENFGVEYSSQAFQDEVIKNQSKIGLPVGAGAYKASTKSGESSNATGASFYEHNVVYFERNDYFLMGKPKIRYINYQVISTNQLMSALYANQVHFIEPSCKQEIIDDLNANKSKGYDSNYVMTNGYGYIGINAAKIPDVAVRRAIMHAINIQLCLDYYPGYASAIYRPMTKASWAYPDNLTDQYYKFDASGEQSEKLVKEAGYVKNKNGVYTKNGHTLKYTFTIAGDTTDHPAYLALKRASEILNAHGFDISIYPDNDALKKLNQGSLTVWAAAWSAAVDPDMYQVYHMDSTATSTTNWGYKAIKNNRKKYDYEYGKVVELSDLIDKARETLVESQRKAIYAQALDIVMDLAVELPTYQRSDLYAYNTKIIDVNSMTPKEDITPYNGPISRIWELSLNEN